MVTGRVALLGTQRKVYRVSIGVWLNLLFGCLLLFIAVQGFASILLGTTPPRLDGPLFWYLVSTGLAAFLLGLWFWQRTRQVQVYENGFYYQQGSRSLVIRWEDIAKIWQRSVRRSVNFIPIGTSHTYIIRTYDGEQVKLTGSIGRVATLGREIQEASAPYLVKSAVERLRAGQGVDFGLLAIHRLGIHNGKMLLPWNEIMTITTQNGYLIIKRQGQWRAWARIPIANLANALIFFTVLNQLRTQ